MILNTGQLSELAQLAETAAADAAAFIRQHNSGEIKVDTKHGSSEASSVVTWVDLKCQDIILKHLQASIQRYDLGLLTEESEDDESRLHKDYFWCIDPLDGTLAFTERRPGYSVSIALMSRSGEPQIGVIHEPITNKRLTAIKGLDVSGELLQHWSTETDKLYVMIDGGVRHLAEYQSVLQALEKEAKYMGLSGLEYISGAGAILQATRVAASPHALYFKLPKRKRGGGSIWDFASTACLFQEMKLPLCDAQGQVLDFNSSHSTFFNHCGIVYATEERLAEIVINRQS
ncbi:3'(2'),5'-bisphosphate nucleotidase CysQ family protein [Reichenbachiella ulvae]|uniref:Inositol monophosphatase family protein n=1 Tax=Reichenbachiella ulvae TaxID=2980104 RepID=A0ABT3CQM7_9BACT|nr:inositol monophosphatase family protein [Reichenbachiella ulvae]MCV9386000.1 inositol monophosphatase family protein [Reichenbachiella ulvae]